MIPYGKQTINKDDIAAVTEVLTSDWLTQGPKVPEFEQAIANACHAKYAIATNSATSALHIACLALGVGINDCVWTTPITFVASANCALYCGAYIGFVDIDLATGNMSISALTQKLAQAKALNKLPKVVIPVHLAGQSCDMQAIYQLSQQYGFAIIEDAAHAIGGKYQQQPIGCGHYADITIFSFHPVKIITSGEGGMALTNNEQLASTMRTLRSHGITSDPKLMTEPSHGPWYYQQTQLGFNYRMTDIHAVLGLSQSKRLHQFIAKRNQLAKIYDDAFANDANIIPLTQNPDCYSTYHLYIVRLTIPNKQRHHQLICALREQNICAHVHYIPIHLQPYYQQFGFKQGDFPQAEQYYQSAITLPLYPDLTTAQQTYVINTLKELF